MISGRESLCSRAWDSRRAFHAGLAPSFASYFRDSPHGSDENVRKAEGRHTFYMVGCVEVSPNHQLMAWTEDTTGNERYTLRVMVRDRRPGSARQLSRPFTPAGRACSPAHLL